jgi:hypothetical protein
MQQGEASIKSAVPNGLQVDQQWQETSIFHDFCGPPRRTMRRSDRRRADTATKTTTNLFAVD